MTQELIKIPTETNLQKLKELFAAFDIAKTGYDVQKNHIREICKQVIQNNIFHAGRDYKYGDIVINKGDRITDDNFSFIIDDAEIEQYYDILGNSLFEAGIANEQGYYITDWLTMIGDSRRALLYYSMENLISDWMPADAKKYIYNNVVAADKFINIIRKLVK